MTTPAASSTIGADMTGVAPPLADFLIGCPTCSYQQGGNPGAEFFLYMMLAMPWLILGLSGYYLYTMRRRETDGGTDEQ